MVAQTIPFSALLQQLQSTTSLASAAKGKSKATTAASRFFSAETPVVAPSTANQDIADAFCKLIEQQEIPADSETGTRKSGAMKNSRRWLAFSTTGFGQDVPFNPPSKTWFDFSITKETQEANDLQQQQQQMEQALQRSSTSSMHTDVYDRDWLLK